MDYLDFDGRTVLVVGGSSGIGNAIARAFHQAGAEVHASGRRALAADYDGEPGSDLDGLDYHPLDVGEAGAVEAWAPPFDRLDVLVLSQGITLGRDELTEAGFRRVVEVNLVSLMACALKFHALLAQSSGSLIVIGSSAAFHATPEVPAYNASKSGALGLTRTLARAWAGDGIRVNAIAPGFIPTRLNAAMMANPRLREAALGRIPLGRFGTAEEIARIALFLASPMASYVVGQTILADGGMLL